MFETYRQAFAAMMRLRPAKHEIREIPDGEHKGKFILVHVA